MPGLRLLECWLAGQAMGGAVADVLTGVVSPSGRLAETIPVRLADCPSYLNFPGEEGHVRYGEGVFVGYRGYDAADRPVGILGRDELVRMLRQFPLSTLAVFGAGITHEQIGELVATLPGPPAPTG